MSGVRAKPEPGHGPRTHGRRTHRAQWMDDRGAEAAHAFGIDALAGERHGVHGVDDRGVRIHDARGVALRVQTVDLRELRGLLLRIGRVRVLGCFEVLGIAVRPVGGSLGILVEPLESLR